MNTIACPHKCQKRFRRGPVTVSIVTASQEDEAGDAWMAGFVREWADELSDPRISTCWRMENQSLKPDEIYLAHFPFGGSPGMKHRPVLMLTGPIGSVPEVLVAYL